VHYVTTVGRNSAKHFEEAPAMTRSKALHSFGDTMTDDEMRDLWQRLDTDGCKMIRYQPTTNASSKSLWRIRITNPSWNGSSNVDNAINVSYKQRTDGSWVRAADDSSWATVV